ncbi:hypothetical protein CO154_00790 [Candidatus Pacearchaeota archaeon CG_4_9_14_3_um_filter_31_7]|nr:MAG: hypothetical protein AUJ10_02480 [Candidatus Pacearchaeota archaeon CG1_02_31_27]PIN92485.1 MAG: hypothetical protein COU55_01625 [Candidatus Pacearchaeota archaeon CG10_big_fil_rev_8_21_14_0_10_31_59]PIZ80801.1 MAG: hypothetical protein COX99_01450 [Candidatus Pacearchaeota archaeon CG_4_10_14_0_2_um_filter_31_10]PJA70839.1 MAG: hypothetical protein CO154_00790 [Candidatus Pacearchaeota archaeon CG_4_9_14_3_um_filter_31_7]
MVYVPTYGGLVDVLQSWADYGIFTVLLPMLLVFVLTYGILSKIKLFGEKNDKISMIIALIVGLIAVTYEPLAYVFMALFQNLAIGIIILLVMVVLMGLFINPTDTPNGWKWFGVVGGILFLWIMGRVFGKYIGDFIESSYVWNMILQSLVILVPIVVIILALVLGGKNK